MMETNIKCNLKSLRDCCLFVIAQNDWLRKRKGQLSCLPKRLVYDLCEYVSPYGLYILEELTDRNVDHFYLTQWTFPRSYTLKAKRRHRNSLATLCSTYTNRHFFYDSIWNEVTEQLIYAESIDKSIEQAWYYFQQYPVGRGYLDDHLVSVDNGEFINILSNHVTTMTVNLSVAYRIMENRHVFFPILQRIEDMNLNMQMKSSQVQHIGNLVEIIKITRQHKLSSVRFKASKEGVLNCYENMKQILSGLFSPIMNAGCCSDIIKTKDDIDYFDEIYYNGDNKNMKIEDDRLLSPECSDLYECVFETAAKRKKRNFDEIMIDTDIVKLELFAYENSFYGVLLHYIKQWKTLQKLHIHGYTSTHDSNLKDVFTTQARYNNLQELTLSEFWWPVPGVPSNFHSEKGLIELAKPSCKIHEIKKSLKTLQLNNCRYRDKFLSSILCHQPSQYCINSTEHCVIDGLSCLTMDLASSQSNTNDLTMCIFGNDTLKELRVNKSCYDSSEDHLLDVVAKKEIKTFSLTFTLKPDRESSLPLLILQNLFQNIHLNHLEFSQICNTKYLFYGSSWRRSLCLSKLTTLVWTRNGMDNNGLIEFARYIPCLRFLKVLDLSGNLFDINGVVVFLKTFHDQRLYLDKLSLGGPYVRTSDVKGSGFEWIIKEHIKIFVGSYFEMDASDHIAQM